MTQEIFWVALGTVATCITVLFPALRWVLVRSIDEIVDNKLDSFKVSLKEAKEVSEGNKMALNSVIESLKRMEKAIEVVSTHEKSIDRINFTLEAIETKLESRLELIAGRIEHTNNNVKNIIENYSIIKEAIVEELKPKRNTRLK